MKKMGYLKLKNHLNKFLPMYVILAMIGGFLFGLQIDVKQYGSIFKMLNQIVVISMIYPMMINLKIEALKKAGKMWKQLTIALIMGLGYSPVIMFLLASMFHISSSLALGLLLAVVVPCSSMSIAYTGFSEGNVELSTIIVALSFTLAIFTVPFWLSLFASEYNVPMPIGILIQTILIVVILPLILGYLTRVAIIKKSGPEKFDEIKPLFPSISLIGMYLIVFLIFMEKGSLIKEKYNMVLIALIPLSLYYIITLGIFTYMNKKLKISYKNHMSITFTATGKNQGTAMAIAMAGGMGIMAIPPAITPLLQIPFLITYVKLAPRIHDYWENKKLKKTDEKAKDS
ncbi:MAG: arsenic resistance protein [Promethearchaeota archaeon]